MDSWHVLDLGDAMVAAAEMAEIRDRFEQEYRSRDCPPGMALYFRHVSDGQLHCRVQLYFPPESVAVAMAVSAEACAPPERDGLGLLAGSGAE